MAVTFVAAGTLAGNATVATQAIVAPACAADDILIAVLVNKSVTSNTISAPDGTWTQITQGIADCTLAADDHEYAVFWKRATGSGGTFTFTKATDDNNLFAGVIYAFRGCPTSGSPLDATAVGVSVNAAAADNVTFPAFDPTNTDSHIVFIAIYGNDLTTFASAMSSDTDPDCTLRDDQETSTGSDASIACISGDTTDGANIASRTWASSSTTDAGSTGIVFGLKVGVFTPAQNRSRIYFDGIESHALAIANNGSYRYLPLSGIAGNYASTPDATANKATTELDVWCWFIVYDKTPASGTVIISKAGAAGHRSFLAQINGGTGNVAIVISTDGTNFDQNVSALAADVPITVGIPIAFRWTWKGTNGLGGYSGSVSYALWAGSLAKPTSWTVAKNVDDTTHGTQNIFNSDAPLNISGYASGATNPCSGVMIRGGMSKTVGGTDTVEFYPDGDATDGAVSITSNKGEVWTLNGSAAVAAEDTAATIVVNQVTDLLVRIGYQETNGTNGAGTDDWKARVSIAAAAYGDLGSGVSARTSPTLTDGATTTQHLANGTGSFVAGEVSLDGIVDDRQLTAANFMEHVFAIRIDPTFFPIGTTAVTFHTEIDKGAGYVTMPYNATPTINVVKSYTPPVAAIPILMNQYRQRVA